MGVLQKVGLFGRVLQEELEFLGDTRGEMVWKEQWEETEFSSSPLSSIVYVNGTRFTGT